MQLIFNSTPNGELVVYITCNTAVEQHELSKKMHTHSEYDTEWDNILDEWANKGLYKYMLEEKLVGRNSIITMLTFTQWVRDSDLIKEVNTYFLGDDYSGYYNVKYTSFI